MTKLTIGQEVAVQSGYNAHNYSFNYFVTKITPKGQVVVARKADPAASVLANEMRFDAAGYRMNTMASRFHTERLVDVAAARADVKTQTKRNAAVAAVNAVRGDAGRYNDKEALQAQVAKLAELLDAARVAVEAL